MCSPLSEEQPKSVYDAEGRNKRTRKHTIPTSTSVYDITAIELENAGKEAKSEYIHEMNNIMADFMVNFTIHYEYCKTMAHSTHLANPRIQAKEDHAIEKIITLQRFPENSEIRKNLSLLRRKAHEIIAIFDCIQDWILAHIPTIKDEDNSGVEVQETVVAQVAGYYKVIKGIYAEEMEYLSRRSELETNHLKQPASDSWMCAIVLHDSQEWDDIENCWRALIRVIMLCQNLLARNMEKLKEPRSKQRAMHI